MTAVQNVAIVGAGSRDSPPPSSSPRPASTSTSSRRRTPRRPSAPASRCRATPCGSSASSASGTRSRRRATPFSTLGLRAPDPRHRHRGPGGHPDRRPGPPGHAGHVPPRPRRILRGRAEQAGASDQLRHDRHRTHGRRRFRHREHRRRRHRPLRPPDRRRRPALRRPRAIGIDVEPQPTGMGIWRAFVSRPGTWSAPSCTTAARLHRRLLPDRRGHHVRVPRREGPGPQARGRPPHHARTRAPTAARGTRSAPTWTQRPHQLHLVHHAHRGRPLEPRPRRHHRRCRAQLPAHDRPGRRQAWRTRSCSPSCWSTPTTSTETLWNEFNDRRLARAKAVVEASVQLGQWLLDGVRDADVPGLMHSVSTMLTEPA